MSKPEEQLPLFPKTFSVIPPNGVTATAVEEPAEEANAQVQVDVALEVTTLETSDGADEIGVRPLRVRGRTISVKRLSKRALEQGRLENPPEPTSRPLTRGECLQGENAERPCPFVSCKYHLYLDVSARSGSIKLNFPHFEVWDLPESCALDVADRGGITLEEVGVIMNLTRERIRQLECKGLAKIKGLSQMAALMDYVDWEPKMEPSASTTKPPTERSFELTSMHECSLLVWEP